MAPTGVGGPGSGTGDVDVDVKPGVVVVSVGDEVGDVFVEVVEVVSDVVLV